jgi:ribonuclease P protein component
VPRTRLSASPLTAAIIVSAIASNRESNRGVEPRGKKLRFPRSVRLLRHADFEKVYKQGRRHFSNSITVFYLRRVAVAGETKVLPSGLRVGFTVGRALGGAVQRNRMKRRLREAVRLSRPTPGPDVDVVINPKKSLLANDFAAVVNEVGRAFVVITEKLEKAAPKSE